MSARRIPPLMVLPPLIFAALALMFYIGLNRDDPNALPSARIGQQAPPVVLTQLGEGPPFTDATLRQPGLKLVNIWASWCGPCRAEHPTLEALAAEGLPIYGVNYKDEPFKALAFLAELGNPYTAIGADVAGRMSIDWGAYGVPETFLIDGNGTILLRFAGPITSRSLKDTVRPALTAAGWPAPKVTPTN